MSTVTVINVSPVVQTVPGFGDVAPGQDLKVEKRVANHLLRSEAWEEPKSKKKSAGNAAGQSTSAGDPAGGKAANEEVTNGAD